MEDNDWKLTRKELPPNDGFYEVTNSINCENNGICEYDGYGFKYSGHYVNPSYWRFHKPLEKRYGKIDDNDTTQNQETPKSS